MLNHKWCLFVTLVFPLAVHASESLAQGKHCFACHNMDKKIVGPAFRDVAARYSGDPSAVDRMMQKITQGGAGAWGRIPMPANPHLSASETRQLAVWIMSLSGGAAQQQSAPPADDPKAPGRSAKVM